MIEYRQITSSNQCNIRGHDKRWQVSARENEIE